ncbi:MAG: hypothetical protein A4S09_11445 [Proteobacteria bacterium SG_bin7]|nr:MAG: hypothetical protein A4S09_11445 [Proteobacteria bacterium SG_bin7]
MITIRRRTGLFNFVLGILMLAQGAYFFFAAIFGLGGSGNFYGYFFGPILLLPGLLLVLDSRKIIIDQKNRCLIVSGTMFFRWLKPELMEFDQIKDIQIVYDFSYIDTSKYVVYVRRSLGENPIMIRWFWFERGADNFANWLSQILNTTISKTATSSADSHK